MSSDGKPGPRPLELDGCQIFPTQDFDNIRRYPMTETMIVRVARAIRDHAVEQNRIIGLPFPEAGIEMSGCIGFARAAVAAMRNPTKGMLNAAYALHEEDTFWDHSTSPPRLTNKLGASGPKEDWRAMIDAALSEDGK